jgi:ParB-like chromosome segregation protein Spo0J
VTATAPTKAVPKWTTPDGKRYTPPKGKGGAPLPPRDPSVSIIVRKDPAVPVDLLTEFHKNPNKGDTQRIKGSVEDNGLYRSICVNVGTLTGRPFEILAGNHTWKAVKAAGNGHIAVDWVDVDDKAARKIVVGDNRFAELGKRDTEALLDLVVDLDDDLVGIGFTGDELARLAGKGEAIEGDADEDVIGDVQWGVIVSVEDESDQIELLQRLMDEGYNVRALMR